MESSSEIYLIVGLGNPGKKYEKTRHNAGFLSVGALAEKWGWSYKKSLKLKGWLAKGVIEDKHVVLLLPATYMNLSGESVGCVVDYFAVKTSHLLVVVDDVYTPFGELRMRQKGSCGGHKGLQNIEMVLGTQDYTRLRIGIGDRTEGSLEDYVLTSFSLSQAKELPQILQESVEVIELWIKEGMNPAMNRANRSRKKI